MTTRTSDSCCRAGPVRVVVVDDESLVRSGLVMLLGHVPDIEVVAEGADGRDALALAARYAPDVVLMDLRMPGMGGIEATTLLVEQAPDCRVLVLSTLADDRSVGRALQAGAAGFILKDSAPQDLARSIRAVAQGLSVLSPRATDSLVARLPAAGAATDPADDALLLRLSVRERQVMALVGAGLTNAEIGARLDLGEGTVKWYVHQLLAKVRCGNRVQLGILAFRAGLVDRTPLPPDPVG